MQRPAMTTGYMSYFFTINTSSPLGRSSVPAMHLLSLLTATLFALLDTAAAVGPHAKRGHNVAQRIVCEAARAYDIAACISTTHYADVCILVVEYRYNHCRSAASNDISNTPDEASTCPAPCAPAVTTCLKNCDAEPGTTIEKVKTCFMDCVSWVAMAITYEQPSTHESITSSRQQRNAAVFKLALQYSNGFPFGLDSWSGRY